MSSDIVNKKDYLMLGGVKGNIIFYENKSIKIFWVIPASAVRGKKRYVFSDELIDISITFTKPPKTSITFTTYIKSGYMKVSGQRVGIDYYEVIIKSSQYFYKMNSQHNIAEPIKVNLCKHPSRHRSQHNSKVGVKEIYKGGTFSPK